MAEDYDTKIRIGIEADLAGGVQTEKEYDTLQQNARAFVNDARKSKNNTTEE